jgi:transposase-like protein
VRANPRAVDLWLDLEEIVRFVGDRFREQVRWPLVHFKREQWIQLLRADAPTHEAAARAFERWKVGVRELGVFREPDPAVAYEIGAQIQEVYALDGGAVQAGVVAAMTREEAASAARARPSRRGPPPPKKPFVRDMTGAQVARALGVSENTVTSWTRRFDLPHDVVSRPGAKRRVLRLSLSEVKEWLLRHPEREMRRDRVPIEVARPRLLEIRDFLELANSRYAELLEIGVPMLKAYMGTGGTWEKMETVPRAVLDKAESLMETEEISPFVYGRLQGIGCDDLKRAYVEHGTLKAASRSLGMSPAAGAKLAGSCGMAFPSKLKRLTKQQVAQAMHASGDVVAKAALLLGVSTPSVRTALRQHGLPRHGNPSADERARRAEREGDRERALREAIRQGALIPPAEWHEAVSGLLQHGHFLVHPHIIQVHVGPGAPEGWRFHVDWWDGTALHGFVIRHETFWVKELVRPAWAEPMLQGLLHGEVPWS